jgi:DnaJ-class molecular chaperone
MSKNVEFIKQASSDKKCYHCDGTGKIDNKECKCCESTGIFKDNHYIVVANNGKQKIAFSVDGIK